MAEATIRGNQTIAYHLSGPEDAPVLLLITGLAGLKEGWFHQVAYFQKRCRILTFDNRGLGGSSLVESEATLADFAEDAVLLMDHLNIDAAHVWGVSMGGKIAQELALGWPERVDHVVLENTSAGEAHRVEGRQPSPLRAMQGADSETWLAQIVPLLFGKAYREANAKAMRAFARSRERRPPNSAAVDIQWNAYERFDSWERLPQLRHSVLCLAGAEDALCHPGNAERLAERLPMAELCIIDGGGHSVHIELPLLVNEAVAAFLGV